MSSEQRHEWIVRVVFAAVLGIVIGMGFMRVIGGSPGGI
jgi:hypothetical protein